MVLLRSVFLLGGILWSSLLFSMENPALTVARRSSKEQLNEKRYDGELRNLIYTHFNDRIDSLIDPHVLEERFRPFNMYVSNKKIIALLDLIFKKQSLEISQMPCEGLFETIKKIFRENSPEFVSSITLKLDSIFHAQPIIVCNVHVMYNEQDISHNIEYAYENLSSLNASIIDACNCLMRENSKLQILLNELKKGLKSIRRNEVKEVVEAINQLPLFLQEYIKKEFKEMMQAPQEADAPTTTSISLIQDLRK